MSAAAAAAAVGASSKRRARSSSHSSSSSSSSSDIDFINVSFDFTSPTDIDFHSIKRQLQQLFYTYSTRDEQLDLGKVADHVIGLAASSGVGTVVKVDQEDDSDPYAFVSLVDLKDTSSAASQTLHNFFSARLASKSVGSSSSASQAISDVLSSSNTAHRPYLVLHERMVNLPAQIATPLYRILAQEIESQLAQKPTHLIFFARIFSAAAFSSDEESASENGASSTKQQQQKKKRRRGTKTKTSSSSSAADALRRLQSGAAPIGGGANGKDQTSMGAAGSDHHAFHPEDEFILKHATAAHIFRFPPPKDAADTYEAPMYGRMLLVEYAKLPVLLQDLEQAFGQPAAAA
ncbi:hypothetical protein IE81DRAFT_305613 [Ceraceosorus guamensis]|uniref:Protein BCP1 n=1 Tax=Ceraceosorus guamensis TaxID=1522189 RepID=A0A316VV15_9BASI|nr:hypothetical protein IE81DRAFT_305613 [Ceraceosorus guamensis]PWN40131.1 hypothetical protein IE81DRAFT_305613 [Ceraceosorus guamensis]